MRPRKSRSPKPSGLKTPRLPEPSNREFAEFAKNALGFGSNPPASIESLRMLSAEKEKAKGSLAETRKFYDRHALEFSRMFKPVFTEKELDAIMRVGNIMPDDKIASVGSGNAVLESFIAKKLVPKGRVSCVDISKELGLIAKSVAEKSGAKNLSIINGSATHLPFKDSTQDKLLAIQTDLSETPFFRQFLKESRRVLKKNPDSRLVISQPADSAAVARIVLELTASGFRPVARGQYSVSLGGFGFTNVILFAMPVSPMKSIGQRH